MSLKSRNQAKHRQLGVESEITYMYTADYRPIIYTNITLGLNDNSDAFTQGIREER